MSVRTRLLLALLVVVAGVQITLAWWLVEDLRPRHLATMEETLVEAAHLVAGIAATGWSDQAELHQTLQTGPLLAQPAQIYGAHKTSNRLRVYCTDRQGRVVCDTATPPALGDDYSRWNNIIRSLRGEYGARATWSDPRDPASAVLHVSQPIVVDGSVVGVATVAKPQAGIAPFLGGERQAKLTALGLALLATALVAGLVTLWATQPIARLRRYVETVGEKRGVRPPRLGPSDLRALGTAFEAMQQRVAARSYVDRYVQGLTHELKSPLASIRGAVEILADDPPPAERERFLSHLAEGVARLQALADNLVRLSAVERLERIERSGPVAVADLIGRLRNDWQATIAQRGLRWQETCEAGLQVIGDADLLQLALANLIANAVSFSPAGGIVAIAAAALADGHVRLSVSDAGPGIPAYARERVFERFYSLPRPDGAGKGTGLGLSLVREIVDLHNGTVTIASDTGGTRVEVVLPG